LFGSSYFRILCLMSLSQFRRWRFSPQKLLFNTFRTHIYIYIDIDIYTTLVCVYKRLEPLAHRAVVQSPIVILGCCSIVLLLDCSHLSSSILPFPMLFLISLFTAFLEGKGIHSIIICWGSQFLSILCTYSYHISYFFSMLSII